MLLEVLLATLLRFVEGLRRLDLRDDAPGPLPFFAYLERSAASRCASSCTKTTDRY
jgi:hypothetical protein